jgi:SnoaL-like domain
MGPQDQLQLLLDEREIREVIYRYVHACDRLDEDEMRTVYHPGAHDEHGPLRGPESEFRPNVLQVLRLAYSFCSHTLGQSRIDFADPDTAFVETYVIAATGREVDGDEVIEVVGGRYLDRFERRSGAWKVADRVFAPDWDTQLPRHRWQIPEQWTVGTRDHSDPSYRR